jgi:hypothetical protein
LRTKMEKDASLKQKLVEILDDMSRRFGPLP